MGDVTVLPPGKGHPLAYQPTERDRHLVRWLAVNGTTQEVIAGALRISPHTLRKHFREELDRSLAEMDAQVAQTIAQAAVNAVTYGVDADGRRVVTGIHPAGITAAIWYQKRRLSQELRKAEKEGEESSSGVTLLLLPGSETL